MSAPSLSVPPGSIAFTFNFRLIALLHLHDDRLRLRQRRTRPAPPPAPASATSAPYPLMSLGLQPPSPILTPPLFAVTSIYFPEILPRHRRHRRHRRLRLLRRRIGFRAASAVSRGLDRSRSGPGRRSCKALTFREWEITYRTEDFLFSEYRRQRGEEMGNRSSDPWQPRRIRILLVDRSCNRGVRDCRPFFSFPFPRPLPRRPLTRVKGF